MSASSSSLLITSEEIASSITDLAKRNGKLAKLCDKIGTPTDNSEMRRGIDTQLAGARQLSHTIMGSLKNYPPDDRQAFHKLTSQFQGALKQFNDISLKIERKQMDYIQSMSHRSDSKGSKNSRLASDASGKSDRLRGTGGGTGPGSSSSSARNNNNNNEDEQQHLIQFEEFNQEELDARRAELRVIERDVNEITVMFRDLQSMVQQQQEGIDSIDQSIEQAADKTKAGHEELIQAESYQKKARRKKCCMLFLLLAALALIVVGVVVLNKS